jgi:hypothetical protein
MLCNASGRCIVPFALGSKDEKRCFRFRIRRSADQPHAVKLMVQLKASSKTDQLSFWWPLERS